MLIDFFRKGNYVDVLIANGGIKTRCEIIEINKDNKIAILKDLSNNSEFKVDSIDKWNLVSYIITTDAELQRLGFVYDSEISVYAFPQKGAWIKGKFLVQKFKGIFDLIVSDSEGFYGCAAIHVPYVHLLQNAMEDNYCISKCK